MEVKATPEKLKCLPADAQTPITIPPTPCLKRLGYGTGIEVWKLERSRQNVIRSPWAIKRIMKTVNKNMKQHYESILKTEGNILKDLKHENIVGYRGIITNNGMTCLAMENGEQSLGDLINNRYDDDLGPFPAQDIMKIGLCIAKALMYLHIEKRLLHGDIKPQNILVKGNFDEVKLCDFGVSSQLNENDVVNNYVGTAVYSAPECQEDADSPITSKSDVFSLGLVLWEMITLTVPHTADLDETEDSFNSSAEDTLINESLFGTRPPLPDIQLTPDYTKIIEIFNSCTEEDPNRRPTAAAIVDKLEKV